MVKAHHEGGFMLRETLKKELDQLNGDQLQQIAGFLAFLKYQAKHPTPVTPLWQNATPTERANEFREWVLSLPKTNISLPDSAFDRDAIYE